MRQVITLIIALGFLPVTADAAKYKIVVYDYAKDGNHWALTGNQQSRLADIEGSEIADYVKDIRADLCETIKPESITVHITVGTELHLHEFVLT